MNTTRASELQRSLNDRKYVRLRFWCLAILLALPSMIGTMSIDSVFPAFPAIGEHFAVGGYALQQIVSVYLVAYALGSLFQGPLADRWGRKPVIVLSLIFYAISTALISVSNAYVDVLILRACQGVFAGSGFVIARVIVRDLFDESGAHRMLSAILLVSGVAPAVAPIIGSVVVKRSGWEGVFLMLSLYAVALAIACCCFLRESLPVGQRVTMNPLAVIRECCRLIFDQAFFWLCIAGALNYASIFLAICSSPVIVVKHLGWGVGDFFYFYAPLILGMISGAWLAGVSMWERVSITAIGCGFFMMATGAGLNLITSLFAPEYFKIFALGLIIQGAGVHLAFPRISMSLLSRCPERLGLGSSIQGFIALIVNAVVAGVISPGLSNDLRILSFGALVLVLLGLMAYLLSLRALGRSALGLRQ